MVIFADEIPKKTNIRWSVNSESGLFACHWELEGKKFELTFGSTMLPNNLIDFVAELNRTETEPEFLMDKIVEQMKTDSVDFSDCFKEEMKGLEKLKHCQNKE